MLVKALRKEYNNLIHHVFFLMEDVREADIVFVSNFKQREHAYEFSRKMTMIKSTADNKKRVNYLKTQLRKLQFKARCIDEKINELLNEQ